MMKKQLVKEIENHIVKELNSKKLKKSDIMIVFKQIFGHQTNLKRQELVDNLTQKIIAEIQFFNEQLSSSDEDREMKVKTIVDFMNLRLKKLQIQDPNGLFLNKLEEALNCQTTEEINFIFNNKGVGAAEISIENVWDSSQNRFIECLCPKAPPNLNQNKKVSTCDYCDSQCHVDCFWPKEKNDDLYQCPFCFLKNCFPDRKVENIVFAGYLPILKKEKSEYKINFNIKEEILTDSNVSFQIRCAKLHSKSSYEIRWPDNCVVYLGNTKLQEFKPLMKNSPLKRRNDEPIKICKEKILEDNELVIEQKNASDHSLRSTKKSVYLIAIVFVKELTKEEVQNKFLTKKMQIQQSKQTLKNYLENGSQELKIQKITVSLKCQYYGNRIQYPARSKLCISHYQPFDLFSFIYSSMFAKTSTKKWKCPICDKRAYDLIIDEYILELMGENKKAMEIAFVNDGDKIIHELNENLWSNQKENLKIMEQKIENEKIVCIDINESSQEENLQKKKSESERDISEKDDSEIFVDNSEVRRESQISFSQKSKKAKSNKIDEIAEIISSEKNRSEDEFFEADFEPKNPPKRYYTRHSTSRKFDKVKKRKKTNKVSCQKSFQQKVSSSNMQVVSILSSDEELEEKDNPWLGRTRKSSNRGNRSQNLEKLHNERKQKDIERKNLLKRNCKKSTKNKEKSSRNNQKNEEQIQVIELLSNEQSSSQKPSDWSSTSEFDSQAKQIWKDYLKMHAATQFDRQYHKQFEGCQAQMSEDIREAMQEADLKNGSKKQYRGRMPWEK